MKIDINQILVSLDPETRAYLVRGFQGCACERNSLGELFAHWEEAPTGGNSPRDVRRASRIDHSPAGVRLERALIEAYGADQPLEWTMPYWDWEVAA